MGGNEQTHASMPGGDALSRGGNVSTSLFERPRPRSGKWYPMYLCVMESRLRLLTKNVLCFVINEHKLGRADAATVSTVIAEMRVSRSAAYGAVAELVDSGLLTREKAARGRAKVLLPAGDAAELLAAAVSEMTKGKRTWARDEARAELEARRAEYRNKLRREARQRQAEKDAPTSVPCSEDEHEAHLRRWGLANDAQVTYDADGHNVVVAEATTRRAESAPQRPGNAGRDARARQTQAGGRQAAEERRQALAKLHEVSLRRSANGREGEEWSRFNARCDEYGVDVVLGAYSSYRARYVQDHGSELKFAKSLVNFLDEDFMRAWADRFLSGRGAYAVVCDFNPQNHGRRIMAMREHAEATRDRRAAMAVDAYEQAWAKIISRCRREFTSARTHPANWLGRCLESLHRDSVLFKKREVAEAIEWVAAHEAEWRELCARTLPELSAALAAERPFDASALSFMKAPAVR